MRRGHRPEPPKPPVSAPVPPSGKRRRLSLPRRKPKAQKLQEQEIAKRCESLLSMNRRERRDAGVRVQRVAIEGMLKHVGGRVPPRPTTKPPRYQGVEARIAR